MPATYGDFIGGAGEASGLLDSFVALCHNESLQRAWLDYVTVLYSSGDMSLEATRYAIARIYAYNPDVVTEADLDIAELGVGLHVVE